MRNIKPKAGNKLKNLKQEMFCVLYATDRDYFGNGTRSYAEAFNIDLSIPKDNIRCRVGAFDLLTKPNILDRIKNLLELEGLNDVSVDKELNFLIKQDGELNTKLGAIKEYNKLKQRIVDKSEINQTLTLNEVLDQIREDNKEEDAERAKKLKKERGKPVKKGVGFSRHIVALPKSELSKEDKEIIKENKDKLVAGELLCSDGDNIVVVSKEEL